MRTIQPRSEGGLHLVTTEVLYYMPAHPSLLQSFVWQTHDRGPRYPRIARFLDHWRREIDAAIHSVSVSAEHASRAQRWTAADIALSLH